MSATESAGKQQDDAPKGITEIAVQGFKSLYDEQRIAVRPLTILAGANNSGKSSIMQPLLMMKQTLEATYDPGPLKLDGPNVYFTSAEQFLSSRRLSDYGGFWGTAMERSLLSDWEYKVMKGLLAPFSISRGRGVDILEIRTSRWPGLPLRPEMEITGGDISEEVSKNILK